MSHAYFDYPLEQGLRQLDFTQTFVGKEYFDYPLEQGLRHFSLFCEHAHMATQYFDYPLEQGLRLKCLNKVVLRNVF